MKQVAQQLKQQGVMDSALYLENLAAELNQAWIETHEFQPDLNKATNDEPLKPHDTETTHHTVHPPAAYSLTTSLNLKAQQQLADAIYEMSQVLHQLNQTLSNPKNQATPTNPLWYMEVLERAATEQWLLTTEEIEQLIGIRPKCHGQEKTYSRGTWTFTKVGKLGAQTAWKVIKTQFHNPEPHDEPIKRIESPTVGESPVNNIHIHPKESLAKHPPLPLSPLNKEASDSTQLNTLEIPEMDDVWA